MTDYPDRQLAPGPPNSLDEKWYKWAGVPVGASYSQADQMVSEAVERLQRERDLLLNALKEIREITNEVSGSIQIIHEIATDILKGE